MSEHQDQSESSASASSEEQPSVPAPTYELRPPEVVCLGASAGGLEALQEFFRVIPPDLGISYVVIVHLSPDFKSLMPELLSKETRMSVRAVTQDTGLEPDHVYIIPPGQSMIFSNGVLELHDRDQGPLHLPIDRCLRSLAEHFEDRCVAIIFSGTGSDGSRGICTIKEKGGVVFAQSRESAKFDGMPTSAAQTGMVDRIDSPAGLAARVTDLLLRPQVELAVQDEEDGIRRVLAVIDTITRIDMTYLRDSMVLRRIRRRMALEGVRSLGDYARLLENREEEALQLAKDLLIGVTSFFRDPKAFAALRIRIIPEMLASLSPQEPLRVWVAACSIGCEVYSLAMLILEAMRDAGEKRPLKIFATDVDKPALERASRGTYSINEVADIPADLIKRYFRSENNRYTILPEVRESIIFAQHNLVTDPPFTRMNLVSCRNLLIYLKPRVQKQVLETLFAALKPETGVLFIGAAEWAAPIANALTCINRSARIYRRTGELPYHIAAQRVLNEPLSIIKPTAPQRSASAAAKMELGIMRRIVERTFEAESRSAALITQDGRLAEILTDPLDMFRLPKGKLTDDLTRIFAGEVTAAISAGLQQLRTGKLTSEFAANSQRVGAIVARMHWIPRGGDADQAIEGDPVLLVLERRESPRAAVDVESVDTSTATRIDTLERELRETKESLQATIEELHTSAEEQQSTNEELIASNEELQSTNEELQSTNEELYTVNAEYNKKNQELQVLTADLNNLLDSMNVATLYLDDELRIRKFTAISRIVPLQEVDLGRPITDFSRHMIFDLASAARDVLESNQLVEREVTAGDGGWILMRISPYNGPSGMEHGVLATFIDVTRIKNAEETARIMSSQVTQKNAALTNKTEQLEDLFSIVAHDLKRPVLGLDSLLALVRRNVEAGDTEAAVRYLGSARTAAASLRTMLKDLSEMSQLSHFDPRPETVDLTSWLDSVMHRFAESAAEMGVALRWVSDHGTYRFARGAAEGILNNLVENALVHGTSNDVPRIDIACHVEAGTVRLSVADNGRGIAPEHHERIFEIFRRLNPTDSDGSGVGLVAARRFAQRAQGNVWVDSDLGRGAKFIAELPIEQPEGGHVSEKETILLVEDDALDAKRVRVALEGLRIRWVRDLAEASEELSNHRFKLVLLDLSLPDGHGLSLLGQLDADGRQTPVLILSGHTQGLPAEAIAAGMVAGTFLKDQIETPSFLTAVKNALLHSGQKASRT